MAQLERNYTTEKKRGADSTHPRLRHREVPVQRMRIGVGTAHWLAPPLPPNRTGGFPASGSPVGGFLIEIDVPLLGRVSTNTTQVGQSRHWANDDGRFPGHARVCGAVAAGCSSSASVSIRPKLPWSHCPLPGKNLSAQIEHTPIATRQNNPYTSFRNLRVETLTGNPHSAKYF